MVISTSAEGWNKAERGDLLREKILEFLKEHPNQAYYARELADEIIGTRWAVGEEQERLIQEVGEDEYEGNREKYDEQIEDRGLVETQLDQHETYNLKIRLGDLIKEGLVEARKVPSQYTDIPYDWETVAHYTYAGAKRDQ